MNLILIFSLLILINISSRDNVIDNISEYDSNKLYCKVKVDSVCISYDKSLYANKFYIKYVNDVLYVNSKYFSINREISDKDIIYKFVRYVNMFYIDKKDKVILEKKKRKDVVSTDYPTLIVMVYNNGVKIFENKTQIGQEEFDIKFNPKFLEFCDFLDKSVINEQKLKDCLKVK